MVGRKSTVGNSSAAAWKMFDISKNTSCVGL
jgi:hypothetical protein